MKTRILEMRASQSVELFQALSSQTRVKILELLSERGMNIGDLAQVLGISQPTVTKHVQVLERAGLIESDYSPGVQGMQKKCSLVYHRFIVSFETVEIPEHNIEQTEMPIGLYTLVHASPPCLLASSERLIGLVDDPQSFYAPDRFTAQLLAMADGFVEYVFPCELPTSAEIDRLELVMEICSEAPHYNNDYPSDITVWINGVEIGTWTSPGDFGGKRGHLNPDWWNENWTQFGMLKVWSVDKEGSYVDGTVVSDTTLKSAMVIPRQPIAVRIGIKPDAQHVGGFNLFGRGFGNYEQDIILRLHYRGHETVKRAAQSASDAHSEQSDSSDKSRLAA